MAEKNRVDDLPQNNPQKADTGLDEKMSPEIQESKEAALAKLKILMDPNLRRFGVRLVSEAEYRSIMETHDLQNREVAIKRPGGIIGSEAISEVYQNFLEYLKSGNKLEYDKKLEKLGLSVHKDEDPWFQRIADQSRWTESGVKQHTHHMLLELFKEARKEASKQKKEKAGGKVKDLTNKEFRERFMEMVDNGGIAGLPIRTVDGSPKKIQIKQLFEKKEPTSKESLLKDIPEEDLQVIREFFENPDFGGAGKIRRFINVFSRLAPHLVERSSRPEEQYELALIFDDKIVQDDPSASFDHWGRLPKGKTNGTSLLGAIVIIPDKERVKEFVDISKTAGEWAHPVFDRNGVVSYPK